MLSVYGDSRQNFQKLVMYGKWEFEGNNQKKHAAVKLLPTNYDS